MILRLLSHRVDLHDNGETFCRSGKVKQPLKEEIFRPRTQGPWEYNREVYVFIALYFACFLICPPKPLTAKRLGELIFMLFLVEQVTIMPIIPRAR